MAISVIVDDIVVASRAGDYNEQVELGQFPGPAHTPYKMGASELELFAAELRKQGLERVADDVERPPP